MHLEGKEISHVKFGNGIVKEYNEKHITVMFTQGEKKFLYPDAFVHFLILKDKKEQAKIDILLDKMISTEEKEKESELKEQERLQRIKRLKIGANSQAAFGLVQNDRDKVFKTWSVFTGRYLSGSSKGDPKIPSKLYLNSACLITNKESSQSEKDRKVIGVFMVSDDFDANACTDGIIQSHNTYRIKLKESETLLFWDYFEEEKKPVTWGRTELKYISISIMQAILKDMCNQIQEKTQKTQMNDLYNYFCYVNRLKQ